MKLLISNDDGIYAPGIYALANRLAGVGHEVSVVCPDRERSATGHGLTLHQPIRAEIVESLFDPSVKAWACSGTPADCVKLALWALLDRAPDFVLSGINQGQNLGNDILYSGTVSAAMEGLLEGIPSIAFSLASYTSRDFDPAAQFACRLLDTLAADPLEKPMLLNVNIPAVAIAEIAGVTLARQGLRRYVDIFEKRSDPRGKTYYWLAGEVLEDIEQPADPRISDRIPTDVEAIRENYITLTPLHYDLTAASDFDPLAKRQFSKE
ncbi:5'/3'-nucleotidase SurE [Oxynema aestuarii]|jgi:5'-nucleotidase|uniref:5'-nucleotidase SurE n=1 Tax=Oxynema aestuarii AP17 TaxID=2064643 RepID=A0A6H1TS98_9CYAN|nr:5'/3'-nucleotidase SurE [Oxynema aestuarii]QIZ69472.1 5'/3'-nucleotidase SurE [Oxynema aestuarii AP17]